MHPDYHLLRSKRKTLCITVKRDAQVVIRAPLRTPQKTIDAFVLKNQDWIQRHVVQAKTQIDAQQTLTYQHGEHIPFLGKPIVLQTGHVSAPQLSESSLILPDYVIDRQKSVHDFLRQQAACYLADRVSYYSHCMQLVPTGLRITSAKTRWGSCSGRNSLCFTYRLICLAPELIDAVVVHELAHILHKNHSAHFYHTIESVLPDYTFRQAALREAGKQLIV